MLYRCECCGESWFMYLEKGIEEFGENHKPSPFTIACPYCGGWAMDVSGIQKAPGGGWAMDVSGIQKAPGGGYVPLPGGYRYFANLEDRDCGVPMLYETGTAPNGGKIVVAGPDQNNRRQQDWRTVDEEVQKFVEAASIFAELSSAWDRKEAREKRQTVERENASRFRQYKASERTWTARKRTGQRQREWRGSWREH